MNWNVINNLTFVNSDGSYQLRNRFLTELDPFRMKVHYELGLAHWIKQANLSAANVATMEERLGNSVRSHRGDRLVTFEIIQFLDFDGVTEAKAVEQMCRLKYRPACIIEMMTFFSAFRGDLKKDSLIALGSSTADYDEFTEDHRSFWSWVVDFVRQAKRPDPAYPMIVGGDTPELVLLPGGATKIDRYTYFIAVHTPQIDDSVLIDYVIDREEYLSLPQLAKMNTEQVLGHDLGQFFIARDGHLCELIHGKDKPLAQAGAALLSQPERDLKHYRPIFK